LPNLDDRGVWDDVAYYRYKELIRETMSNVLNGLTVMEGCLECPLFRVNVNGNYVSTRCRVITKCIKKYPHIYDNKEFK
jgi:hypothetical protein